MPQSFEISSVRNCFPRHNIISSTNNSAHLQTIHHQQHLVYLETSQHNGRPSFSKDRSALSKRWPKIQPYLTHNLNPSTIIPVPRNPIALQATTRNRTIRPNNAFNNIPRSGRRPTLGYWNHLRRVHNIPRASGAKGRSYDIAYGSLLFSFREAVRRKSRR